MIPTMTLRQFILLTLLPLVGAGGTKAQSVFYPDHLGELNMGEVLYDTPKKDSIQFRNTGNQTLVIHRIEPSCGCLKAYLSPDAAIEPDKGRGWIVVEYDGKQLGTFERHVKVWANDQKEPHVIYFRGRVVQELIGSAEDYPYNLGNVRMDRDHLDFGIVHKGDSVSLQLKVFNASMSPYRPSFHQLPAYLSAKSKPVVIASERSGVVTITLDSNRLPNLGLNQDAFFLAGYSESVQLNGRINSTAVLAQDFSSLTPEERANAPRLTLQADTITFGPFDKKKQIKKQVVLTNTGKSDLKIYSVDRSNSLLTSLSMKERTIRPGKKVKMLLTLTPEDIARAATHESSILLMTNDPDHAAQYIYIRVEKGS